VRVRHAALLVPLLALFLPGLSTAPFVAPATAPASFIDDAVLLQAGMRGSVPMADPAGDWLVQSRQGPNGRLNPRAYERALRQAEALARRTERVAPEVADAAWTGMGPTNIGGRVSEVAVDPVRGAVISADGPVGSWIYAATASGGLWKSTDGGATWTYAWDPNLTQAMGAVAVGSDGVIYAGTGEANPGGGSIVFGGTGVYRSTDGGTTWQLSGLPTSGAIGRIMIDPKDPKTIFVAATGNLFVPGGERGLYRSTDGGTTWTRVLEGANDTTGAVDIAIDPVNPNNILVGMWDHVRLPTHRVFAGVGSGVYRSTDGGDTWTRVSLPTGTLAPKEVGRIGVAIAPSNPSRAYAIVANRLNGNGVGLYRSDNGGATWTNTGVGAGSLSQSSYGWWFGKIWVDPANADRLFVAGLELVESTNGGSSFTAHSVSTVGVVTGLNVTPHADQHGMVWDPSTPGRVYLANDGGIFISNGNGQIGTWAQAATQGWTQHYTVDVSEQNPGRVVSGLQDNMCQRNYLDGPTGHPSTWTKYGLCGDGLQTLVKPTNERIIYGCAQYGGGCSRTLDDGNAFLSLGATDSDRRGWLMPIVFDPNDDTVLYAGGNKLNRSTNQGDSWEAISPDLTTDPPQLDPNSGYRIYGTITTIAASKSSPGTILVGTDDSQLQLTTDGGNTWTELDDHDDGDEDETDDDQLPSAWITRVVIDPSDANTLYATFSGFRAGDDAAYVVKSTDGGFIWDDISGNLPNAPVIDLVQVGSKLVVATDVGVYMSTDGGAEWLRVGTGLPTVPVLDIEYHAPTNTITVATFGAGIQRTTLP